MNQKTTTPPDTEPLLQFEQQSYLVSHTSLEIPEGFNVRSKRNVKRDLGGLVEAFKNPKNTIPPLLGYWQHDEEGNREKFIVTSGARRTTASRIASDEMGGEVVMVAVTEEPDGYTEMDRQTDLLKQNAGLPFDALEKAALFARLSAEPYNLNNTEIGKRCGISRVAVSNYLLLDQVATPELRTAIAAGRVSATFARDLAREFQKDPEAMNERLAAAISAAAADGKDKATAAHGGASKNSKTKPSKSEQEIAARTVEFDCYDCKKKSRVTLPDEASKKTFNKLVDSGTKRARCPDCMTIHKAKVAEESKGVQQSAPGGTAEQHGGGEGSGGGHQSDAPPAGPPDEDTADELEPSFAKSDDEKPIFDMSLRELELFTPAVERLRKIETVAPSDHPNRTHLKVIINYLLGNIPARSAFNHFGAPDAETAAADL